MNKILMNNPNEQVYSVDKKIKPLGIKKASNKLNDDIRKEDQGKSY
jgi:hypothetical protein